VEQKLTPLVIKNHCGFAPDLVSVRAKVPRDTMERMILSQPVKKSDAETLLAYLSQFYVEDYTLETVEVVLEEVSHE
jgi:hypothetical protein